MMESPSSDHEEVVSIIEVATKEEKQEVDVIIEEENAEDEENCEEKTKSDEISFTDFDVFANGCENLANAHSMHPMWTQYFDACVISQDLTSYEDLIMQFCICHLPMKKQYCLQWRNYIRIAQEDVSKGNYGSAIARYKDFQSFVDNFAVSKNKCDFSTGRIIELKTLANERVSLCYLLKNSPQIALRFAQKAIVLKPVVPQSHLWRAIAYRRLGNYIAALRSLSIFGTLISASLEDSPYLYEEQRTIVMYWKAVLVMVQQSRTDLKLLHFPSFNIIHYPPKEQEERMSITFLMNNPSCNCMIHSDAFSLHLLPVWDGSFIEALQEQKQAYGFKHSQEDSWYFSFLPDLKYFGFKPEDSIYQKYNSETAKKLWDTSAFINSTSCQMSLKPGKGLFEHFLYCQALLKDEEYEKIIPEYQSILADLAIFPVLSDEEWTDNLALIVDANIEVIENSIELFNEHIEKELEVTREIDHIKQWLELHERKFRVKKRILENAEWMASLSSSHRNYSSPKKKFVGLHKFLYETKAKRNLFPKE